MKRFHGHNDDVNLIKKYSFNEAVQDITEKSEKNSENIQKELDFFIEM